MKRWVIKSSSGLLYVAKRGGYTTKLDDAKRYGNKKAAHGERQMNERVAKVC